MPNYESAWRQPYEKQLALPSDDVVIALPERFTFHNHREFRAWYFNDHSGAWCYAIDFHRTRFIDSAGLGMILQLIEHVKNDPARIRLINVPPEIKETLLIAGFDQLPLS